MSGDGELPAIGVEALVEALDVVSALLAASTAEQEVEEALEVANEVVRDRQLVLARETGTISFRDDRVLRGMLTVLNMLRAWKRELAEALAADPK